MSIKIEKRHQSKTGWVKIDELFEETDQMMREYNEVRNLIEQSHSSFRPRRPFWFVKKFFLKRHARNI